MKAALRLFTFKIVIFWEVKEPFAYASKLYVSKFISTLAVCTFTPLVASFGVLTKGVIRLANIYRRKSRAFSNYESKFKSSKLMIFLKVHMGTHKCVTNATISCSWGKSNVLNFNGSSPVSPRVCRKVALKWAHIPQTVSLFVGALFPLWPSWLRTRLPSFSTFKAIIPGIITADLVAQALFPISVWSIPSLSWVSA